MLDLLERPRRGPTQRVVAPAEVEWGEPAWGFNSPESSAALLARRGLLRQIRLLDMAKLNTAPISAPARPANAQLSLPRYAIDATPILAMPPMLQIAQKSANPFKNCTPRRRTSR